MIIYPLAIKHFDINNFILIRTYRYFMWEDEEEQDENNYNDSNTLKRTMI